MKQLFALGGAALAVSLFVTGCCSGTGGGGFSPCAENVKQNLPFITCQPLDQEVDAGKKARFYVKAKGKDLKYQWFYIGGGVSADPNPIPGATKPLYEIPSVVPLDHYGLYFCAVYRGDLDGHKVTHSRQASLGGRANGGPGGTFAAVQNPVQTSGQSTVCGNSVGSKWTRFPGTQTPVSPDAGFRGNLWKVVSGTEVLILRSTYYLQWLNSDDTSQQDCCTDITGSTTEEVQCTLIPGNPYSFTAFFKAGQAPPSGTTIILKGTWTQ